MSTADGVTGWTGQSQITFQTLIQQNFLPRHYPVENPLAGGNSDTDT
jgi:hypothetical protein